MELSSEPFSTKDSSDQLHNITVHAFSLSPSPTQAIDIIKTVFDALDRQESSFTLDSGNLVYSQFAGTNDIFKEPDGKTWHGVINFNFLIN